jgi:hypothetical protein
LDCFFYVPCKSCSATCKAGKSRTAKSLRERYTVGKDSEGEAKSGENKGKTEKEAQSEQETEKEREKGDKEKTQC